MEATVSQVVAYDIPYQNLVFNDEYRRAFFFRVGCRLDHLTPFPTQCPSWSQVPGAARAGRRSAPRRTKRTDWPTERVTGRSDQGGAGRCRKLSCNTSAAWAEISAHRQNDSTGLTGAAPTSMCSKISI